MTRDADGLSHRVTYDPAHPAGTSLTKPVYPRHSCCDAIDDDDVTATAATAVVITFLRD